MLFDDTKLTVLGFVSGFLGVIVLAVSEGAICTTDQETYPSDFYADMQTVGSHFGIKLKGTE
ncbi:hypothetical protein DZA52_03795 [Vibrio campbellii]|jgi:hypothetical protein|nr:hypothetical protein BWP24_12965 [Vibrio campbellii]ARR45249.1 hypothetical protein CAY59_13270 [Vibrio campbellii]AUW02768.1 hypothetical protein C1N51_02720 [Vibrio campbellii]AYO08571.1 hypothetical protein D0784_03775 [Vibrio campbellii]OPH49555.1 hypothetical protein B4U81_21400 [Vibrio campbellii]